MIDFRDYIQNLRRATIEKIEKYLKDENIKVGLEVGAGDGFQSRLLVEQLEKLTVCEYSENRLQQIPNEKINYFIGDAENLEHHIKKRKFDLIFSSHLLEHLPHVDKLLHSCRNLVSDKGYIIHVVPSKWYAFFRVVFWYPSLCVRIYKKLKNKPLSVKLLEKTDSIDQNNMKLNYKPRARIFNLLIPRPHGVSDNLLIEYNSMKRGSWTKLFQDNDLKILEVINGSCFSGYGFGLNRSKQILSKLGIACEYIYILRKSSHND
jgi:2-polyprenyl-3-methyl-5-hydroxy-6-metoxy-1,4-benzoquinol methylase